MQSIYSRSCRQKQPASSTPSSPRLLRSRSGTPAGESRTCNNSLTNPKQSSNANRSKSTSRSSRNRNDDENVNPSRITNAACIQKKAKDQYASNNKDGFVRFLQRESPFNKARSVTNSPSAWALSPGRSSPCLVTSESQVKNGTRRVKSSRGVGSGVSGVLKYFRQKKVSSVQEEEFHKLRVMHNRLLQYRCANAKAHAAVASLKNVAEGKIFGVWVRVLKIRNIILEKKIEVEKLKREIKLCQIVNPQIRLLNDWAKLEGKNIEAVSRVTRKLSALCAKIPIDDAKIDVKSIYEAMSAASQVMNGVEATITKFLPQIDRILFMLTELVSTVELEEECLEQLDAIVASVPPLTVKEKYKRVQLIQAAEELRRG